MPWNNTYATIIKRSHIGRIETDGSRHLTEKVKLKEATTNIVISRRGMAFTYGESDTLGAIDDRLEKEYADLVRSEIKAGRGAIR